MENSDPNVRAYNFYRKLGWEPVGEFRDGEQMLKLTRATAMRDDDAYEI